MRAYVPRNLREDGMIEDFGNFPQLTKYIRMGDYTRATQLIEKQRQEIGRLTKCLEQANKNHEEFERKWSLATEEIARLQDALVEERDQ